MLRSSATTRVRRRGELRYPGGVDNRIEVLGTDGSRRQLVLFVEEARRAFTLRLARHVALPLGARVLHQDRRFPSSGAPS